MTMVAPWTVLDSKVAFADPWLRVRSDRVRTADGDVFGPFRVIEYPDWVTIVSLTVREYRHGVGAVLSGLPGGLVDPGDSIDRVTAAEAAARRELREETGCLAGEIERLATLHPNPSNQTNTAYCFLPGRLFSKPLISHSDPHQSIHDQAAPSWCLHAPGWHPHRLVAHARRLAGRQLQPPSLSSPSALS